MIKSTSLSELSEHGFSYITAITKTQIETLLRQGVIEYGLFDTTLCEVEHDGVRYVYRRNPQRAEEINYTRESKKARIEKLLSDKNLYLAEHSRASVDKALKAVTSKAKALNVDTWLSVSISEETARSLRLNVDEDKLAEQSRLDGCYVLKTDLSEEEMVKEDVHARYKDLSNVERAFREMKTEQLELRPLHVTEVHPAQNTRAY